MFYICRECAEIILCMRKLNKVPHLQHELHTDAVLNQPHDQVCLALEHFVVVPGERVWVFDRKMQVWGRAETNIMNIRFQKEHYSAYTCLKHTPADL